MNNIYSDFFLRHDDMVRLEQGIDLSTPFKPVPLFSIEINIVLFKKKTICEIAVKAHNSSSSCTLYCIISIGGAKISHEYCGEKSIRRLKKIKYGRN